MNNVKSILENSWDFTIYKINNFYAIEIEFFESVVDYNICYKLSEEDIRHIKDIDYFKKLSESIRKNKDAFLNRSIKTISWWKNN